VYYMISVVEIFADMSSYGFVVCACIWNYVLVCEWIKFIRRFVSDRVPI